MRSRGGLLAAVFVALVAMVAVTFGKLVTVRTEMADFLPRPETPAAAFLLDQLQTGTAASLLLIGVENAPQQDLARLSKALAAGLGASGQFRFVANGTTGLDSAEERFLLDHRYLLSPATTADAFTVPSLRQDLQGLLRELGGSTSFLVKRYGFRDPIGAFYKLVGSWVGSSNLQTRDGVWFSDDGRRALLLARTDAKALDLESQRRAIAAVDSAFAASDPGGAELLVSGPGVFAVRSAEAIEGDVRLVSTLAVVGIVAFLLLRYRSVQALAAAGIPLMAGTAVAALAVQAVDGFVHGITLGFGMTMLGVAVDYPLLLMGQHRGDEPMRETARRIGAPLLLAVGAATLGLLAMLFSPFPGLSQLGLFAAIGLVVAASVTRWVLPLLLGEAKLRDQSLPVPAIFGRLLLPLTVITGVAALWLVLGGAPRWETDLATLGQIPAADRNLDEELRRQLGAPDVRYLVAISGDDAQAVLQASETLDTTLQPLRERGALKSYELPSLLLPSAATQARRQAAIPASADLQERLTEAAAGLPFKASGFDPFLADTAAQRTLPPVLPGDPMPETLRARLHAMLSPAGQGWVGVAALVDVTDAAAVKAAVNGPGLTFVDIKGETEGILSASIATALHWLLGGLALVVALLGLTLRREALPVLAPLGGALVLTLAILSLLDVRLGIAHLVAILLGVGVSLDYGLFLNRTVGRAGDAQRTLGAVVNCSAATLLTFGLLAFARNPIMHGIGLTVALAAATALLWAVVAREGRRPRDAAA
ncbi:MAG: MMPL family transporter [Geminicoccaceae bacterium]